MRRRLCGARGILDWWSHNLLFVGSFIGTPPMNFLKGKIQGTTFVSEDTVIEVPKEKLSELDRLGYREKSEVILGIRPEHVKEGEGSVQASIDLVELIGSESIIFASIGDKKLVSKTGVNTDLRIGDKVNFSFNMQMCHFFDVNTENRIKILK